MGQIYLQARSFCHIIYCTSQCVPTHTVHFLSVLAHTETLLGFTITRGRYGFDRGGSSSGRASEVSSSSSTEVI